MARPGPQSPIRNGTNGDPIPPLAVTVRADRAAIHCSYSPNPVQELGLGDLDCTGTEVGNGESGGWAEGGQGARDP